MFFVIEDPMAAAPSRPSAKPPERKAPRSDPPLRFSVSEGAERYVGFWLVGLGIVGFLALVALIGFGPR